MVARFYFQGHTYQFVTTARTWAAANSYASSQGGHLAYVNSAAENGIIFSQSSFISGAPTASDGGGASYIWLGATDSVSEGTWRWSNNTSVTGYTNWGSGPFGTEPDNYLGNQDGMAMGLQSWPRPNGGIGIAGEWNDINTANAMYSVIEWDYLRGTAANDSLVGTAAGNLMMGFTGSDTFIGGLGRDIMRGGVDSARDVFDFNAIGDSRVGATGRDVIYDFRRGIDDLDLRTMDARAGTVPNDNFAFSGRVARPYSVWFTAADADNDGQADDVLVRGDVNGNTTADFEIALIGVTVLTAGDFIL